MSTKNDSLVSRVQTSYQQLSTAATTLNTVSDQLSTTIADLDAALKKLNLGISAWVEMYETSSDDGFYFTKYQIGYDKIGGKWGIGIQTISGNLNQPDDMETEYWLFNDAPRRLRLKAIEKIPDLLERLTKESDVAAKDINAKLQDARSLATAINAIADKK